MSCSSRTSLKAKSTRSTLDFFTRLNDSLGARSFPIHAELKLDGGRFMPIELNPMRYGGFGLADLTWHAFGFDPPAPPAPPRSSRADRATAPARHAEARRRGPGRP